MSWNGHTVIDMDAHIRERADTFFKDYSIRNTASLSTASAKRSPGSSRRATAMRCSAAALQL